MKNSRSKKSKKDQSKPEMYIEITTEEASPTSEEIAQKSKKFDDKYVFLSVAGGMKTKNNNTDTADVPTTNNLLWWKKASLYKLRSELIDISLQLDQEEAITSSIAQNLYQRIADRQREEENAQPLRFSPIVEIKPEITVSTHGNTRNTSPSPRFSSDQTPEPSRNTRSEPRSSTGRSRPSSGDHYLKQLKQDSIWDNTELFCSPILNLNTFSEALKIRCPYVLDPKVLSDPLGQHYSIRFSQMDQLKNDPIKSKIILPSTLFDKENDNLSSRHFHNRLIAAMVKIPMIEDEITDSKEEDQSASQFPDLRKGEEYLNKMLNASTSSKKLNKVSDKSTPTPQGMGVSAYGMLSFDIRLKLELMSLNLHGRTVDLTDSYSPVIRCLKQQQTYHINATAKANQRCEITARCLESIKDKFRERYNQKITWDTALMRYLENKKSSKKKKSGH